MRKLIILLIFLLACLGASAQNIGNYVNDRPAATSSEIDSSLVLIISRQTPLNKSKKMRLDSLAKKLGGGSGGFVGAEDNLNVSNGSGGGKATALSITGSTLTGSGPVLFGSPIEPSVSGALNLGSTSQQWQSLAMNGIINFQERASSGQGTSTGRGYLFVKNTTPNTLIFQNDQGVEIDLTAGGGGSSGLAGNVNVSDGSGGFAESAFSVSLNAMTTTTGNMQLSSSGSAVVIADNLEPSVSGALNLGSTSQQWQSLAMNGVINFQERASSGQGTATGRGYLFVKNTTPNTLIFQNDQGVEIDLTAGRREVTLTLTDAQIKATNTTPINLIPSSEVASNQVVIIYNLYAQLTGTTAYNESAFLTARVIGTTGQGQALTFLDVDGTLPNFANRQGFLFTAGLVDPRGVGVEISNTSPADLTGGNAANQVKIVVEYSLLTIP